MPRFFKELGKAFFIGTLIFLVLVIIQYLNAPDDYDITGKQLFITFLYNQLYSVILYMANAWFFIYMREKYGNELFNSKHLSKGILGSILVTIVSLIIIRSITEMLIDGKSFTEFVQGEQLQFYYVAFIISIVVTSIFYLVFYYKFRQENKVKEQKIIAGRASAQFDALKNQLDPHFLFNSLNVLTSLIEENPDSATRFTTSLSKVYRYVLEQKNKELVSVEEELRFADLYMSLIKMRFEDSIIYDAPKSVSDPEAKVVPLSLQLLLENAVKHNMVTPANKLHIIIYEQDGHLVVKNNVQAKSVVKESSGVGLQNIRQRYRLITERPVIIEQDSKDFRVAIPLLTRSVRKTKTQESYIRGKRYERAKKKVEEIKGFYVHLCIYLIMVPVFIYLNVKSTSFPWALFPIGGWGLGVIGHASEVYDWNPFFGKDWEERQIRKFMDEES